MVKGDKVTVLLTRPLNKGCQGDGSLDTYDAWGRLTNFSDSLGETASYSYYSDGLRASKTIGSNTTKYYYDGDSVINETLNGNSYATNVLGADGYISRKQNGTVGYLFKNAHGDVLSAYSSTTNKLAAYTYDAWGNEQSKTETSNFTNNPLRYCGEYYDYESGMTYLRARYYDSDIKRFISEDPAKDGLNWYIYCYNNPLRLTDPTGLKPGDPFKTLDEAAIDAGNYYLEKTYQNDEEMCGLFYKNADGTYTYQDVANTSNNKRDAFYINWSTTPLAVIHTHVYRDVDDPNNQFSYPGWTSGDNGNSDTDFSDNNNIPLYLAAPTGELKLYNPNSGNNSGMLISDKLVVDPKYTTYPQIKNTLLWGLLDAQYPSIDKMDIVKTRVKYPDSIYNMLKELGIIN